MASGPDHDQAPGSRPGHSEAPGSGPSPTQTAFLSRVARDAEAMAPFKAQGMPRLSYGAGDDSLLHWLQQDGLRLYRRWVISRPESYSVIWALLPGHYVESKMRQKYFDDVGPSTFSQRVAAIVWHGLAPPPWLWLALLAVPWVEWRCRQDVSAVALLAALCVPVAYVFDFATYHAAGTEAVRHMHAGFVVYRIGTACGLAVLTRRAVERFRGRRGEEARARRLAAEAA